VSSEIESKGGQQPPIGSAAGGYEYQSSSHSRKNDKKGVGRMYNDRTIEHLRNLKKAE